MAWAFLRPWLALAALLLMWGAETGLGSCLGGSCAEQAASAQAQGLLGSTLGSLGICEPKKYPTTGSLVPVTLDTRITDVRWVNVTASGDVQHVYAITQDKGGFNGGPLWRTEDPGRADGWRDITSTLIDLLPGKASPYFGISDVKVSPALPQHLFLQGRGRYHFVSRDGGRSFSAIPTPGNSTGYEQTIKWHPTQPEWLLAMARRPGCVWYVPSDACGYDLFVTQDLGASWANLTANSKGHISSFRDYEWGASLPMYAGKKTPDEAIFATVFAGEQTGKGLYPGWNRDLHYVVSLDLFRSPPARTIPCGNLFEVVAGKVFLAVPSDCPLGPDGKARAVPKRSVAGRTVTLYVSDTDGDDFTEVCLPSNLEDDGYNMVRTHDGAAAFVLADHAEPGSRGPTSDSPTSDAYAPAYNASLHTLALRNVYRRDYLADFLRVEGLPGVFIANAVDDRAIGSAPVGDYGAHLRTLASRDGGASWAPVAAPRAFRFGQCNACEPGADARACSLHLHGATSWANALAPRPNLYSPPAAPGLLLASGNVGAHLATGFGAGACTWVSRDGGLTWEDVADRSLIYEVGARGDVVVAAGHSSDGPTATVRVSLDAGACWHEVALPEAILVDNIRADTDARGTVFFVHGTACTRTSRHPDCTFRGGMNPPGKLFVLDLAALMGPADLRACGDDDYELWAPPDAGGCLLGARREVQRRRADARCVTPASRELNASAPRPCACSRAADAECEYGFAPRVAENGSVTGCEAIAGLEAASCPRWNANQGYAASSTHLRLVHGDICADPKTIIPDTDGKGGSGGGPRGGGGCHDGKRSSRFSFLHALFVTLLVAGIVAVVAGVVWTQCLGPASREAWAERLAPATAALGAAGFAALDAVIAAWDWLRFKWAELTNRGAARDAYFEPLTDRLDVDPEDHRSPPMFDGP